MTKQRQENPLLKRNRILTQITILSVTLNVALMTTLLVQKNSLPPIESFTVQHIVSRTNADVLKEFFTLEFNSLVQRLTNKTLLQDGYTHRDLALSVLVGYHYLNIEKALSGFSLDKRKCKFAHVDGGEEFELLLYPGLQDWHFDMLENYIGREKWPLTNEGLFYELKKELDHPEKALVRAFVSTDDFYTVLASIKRFDEAVKGEHLLKIILSCRWHHLAHFIECQKKRPQQSRNLVRELMHAEVSLGNKEVARFWLSIDEEYVYRKLSDEDALRMVALIEPTDHLQSQLLEKFSSSMRSSKVVDASKNALNIEKTSVKEAPRVVHRVQSGESLWKISRKYKVSINDIVRENHLSSERLYIDQELIIP